jgi:hypothetical protein
LFEDGEIEWPPWIMSSIFVDAQGNPVPPTMAFYYLLICLKKIPRVEILGLCRPQLWPFALLAKEKPDRIIVATAFAELLATGHKAIIPLAYMAATWVLPVHEQYWLQKEFQKMYGIVKNERTMSFLSAKELKDFQDALAAERLAKEAAEKEAKKAEKEAKKAEREAKKAEKEAKKAEKEARSAGQKAMTAIREVLVDSIDARFPALVPLAEKQANACQELLRLQIVMMRINRATDEAHVQKFLQGLTEEETAV